MITVMSGAGIHRRLVALAAAYALALQGLLTAAVAIPPTLAPDVAICSGRAASHGEAGRNGPVHHADCPLCALACGSAAALPPRGASLIPAFGPGAAMLVQWAIAPVVLAEVQGWLARAPPA